MALRDSSNDLAWGTIQALCTQIQILRSYLENESYIKVHVCGHIQPEERLRKKLQHFCYNNLLTEEFLTLVANCLSWIWIFGFLCWETFKHLQCFNHTTRYLEQIIQVWVVNSGFIAEVYEEHNPANFFCEFFLGNTSISFYYSRKLEFFLRKSWWLLVHHWCSCNRNGRCKTHIKYFLFWYSK